MAITMTDPLLSTPPQRFTRVVHIWDRSATSVSYTAQADTLCVILPPAARPGRLLNECRAAIPADILSSVMRDFPSLRRQMEVGEITVGQDPIEVAPSVRRLNMHVKALWVLILIKTAVIATLVEHIFLSKP